MRIGVLEILIADAALPPLRRLYCQLVNRHYASLMPQVLSCWSRQLGHETFYATYYGQADPKSLLPDDLDVVFLSSYTSASSLAYALAKLYRREGTLTVLGGPHAKGFPEDSNRFFDVVVGECDRVLFEEILRDRPRGVRLSSPRPLRELPSIEERLPEVETAYLRKGRAGGNTFIGVLASLGCPYACDFCTDWDNPYRLVDLDRLEADLRFVAAHYPHAKVAFHDPNFAVKFDAVLEVLERLPAPGPNRYLMQSSLSVLTEPRLARLRATRCYFIAPGVESWDDYSNKSKVRRSHSGWEKLDQLVDQFDCIYRYVPTLQANIIPGVDSDAGGEPFELSKAFMTRAPAVWTNFNVPTPFGGTPLYEQHLREGRILGAMPFAFYYTPYLVTQLLHYSTEDYYGHMIDLVGHLVSPEMIARRSRAFSGAYHALHAARLLNGRRVLREFRSLRSELRNDPAFRRFHEGRSQALPAFYDRRFRSLLGRYASLLEAEDLRPRLVPGRAAARPSTPALAEPPLRADGTPLPPPAP